MGHLRHLPDWPSVPADPEDPAAASRPATRQDLLDRWSLVPVGEHPAGGWIMDCGVLGPEAWGEERAGAHDDLPGTPLTREGPPAVRYLRGPAEVQAHACRAVVYREEGADLRASLAAGHGPPVRSPAGRGALTAIDHREADPEAVARAARGRLQAQDPEAPPAVRRLRVPPADVTDSDVVEVAAEPAHRWAGER